MSQVITTHNADGRAVFSSKVPEQQNDFPIPLGQMTLLYSTHTMLEVINTEQDIDNYIRDRVAGFGPGVACPAGGTSGSILHLAPGLKSPMRRQPTIGVFYVLAGELMLHLDSGESRKLKPGDSGVLRGGMHSWSNETPDGCWAKLINFSQSIEPPDVNE